MRTTLRCFVAVLLLSVVAWPAPASADCSDRRIRRLAAEGQTNATIARTCDIEVDDVQEVLDEEVDDDVDNKLPTGTPIGQCGCWGPADPNYQQPHAQCESGYAHPQSCNTVCPAGGFAWVGVCT